MSKPDRQLTLIEAFRYFKAGELTEREAEQQIKDLMLEIQDEALKESDSWSQFTRMLRQKVAEL